MITLSHEPPHRPYRIHLSRNWRVTGAVLLAHMALAWLLVQGLITHPPTAGEMDNVIMASMVMDMPAPPAPKPQPVQAKPKTLPTPLSAVQPALHPSPVVTQAVPSEAAPVVPAAASAATTAPAAAANQRPNTTPSPVVSLPSSDADYLNNPAPAYPRMSRRQGEQGTVVLRVFINTEGRADKAEIRTSSGYSRLDEAALETVKRWRYVPGKRAGVPEAMWFNVPIRFVLD
ncbi:MAG: energy transducer TonB [Limnohabitans sp.]|nr:MAG: energy transducer TonB [Limnohabitans sp.]